MSIPTRSGRLATDSARRGFGKVGVAYAKKNSARLRAQVRPSLLIRKVGSLWATVCSLIIHELS